MKNPVVLINGQNPLEAHSSERYGSNDMSW